MRHFLKPGEHLNIVFDSTGLKVYGEGEWKVRKHGYSKRRTWRKVHVGMSADTGQIVVSAISSNDVSDDEAMFAMMTALKERDNAIQRIKELGEDGRAKWKQEIGYHQRSLVETHMFRHKAILGDRLAARKGKTQATEVVIKCDVLN